MKIFAIDDERAPLYFLNKAITEAYPNDTLKVFNDYNTFIEEFKKELPDIAFLDVMMPEMDGIELAKRIIEIKNNINIVFVTAFNDYAIEAFKLNATSYIVKPASKDKIINAISHLRFPIEDKKDIEIKTFGTFNVLYKGSPIKFRSERSKEILAYLVDREGALVTKKELASIVYEDDYSNSIQAILSRNIKYLEEDLTNAGINNFLFIDNGSYYVDLSLASCDLIDYLNNKDVLFLGEYMEQYSWGEFRKLNLKKN